eukprot:SAG31_NODE_40201_length_282_cov_0.978142_1_plen_53_part_10
MLGAVKREMGGGGAAAGNGSLCRSFTFFDSLCILNVSIPYKFTYSSELQYQAP